MNVPTHQQEEVGHENERKASRQVARSDPEIPHINFN